MNLIVIYGPPASGKLTIANKLKELTGYNVFHNHSTANLVSSLFPTGTKEYSDLTEKIRLSVFEAAAKSNIRGIIFTFAFGVETCKGERDALFLKNISKTVSSPGGKVFFVRLSAERKDLLARLGNLDRKKLKKLTDKNLFNKIAKKFPIFEKVPIKSLDIDTSKNDPRKAASLIRDFINSDQMTSQ